MRYLVLFLLALSSLFAIESRSFLDINDKPIVLPEQINRIYGSAPPITFMLYVIDDAPLVGVNFPQNNKDNSDGDKFLSKHFMSLPILGGFIWQQYPQFRSHFKCQTSSHCHMGYATFE